MSPATPPSPAFEPEVVGADLPPEPPVGTIVVDAEGKVFQRKQWRGVYGAFLMERWTAWTGVGERKRAARPSWLDLLDLGPVTILWRPAVEVEPAEPATTEGDQE